MMPALHCTIALVLILVKSIGCSQVLMITGGDGPVGARTSSELLDPLSNHHCQLPELPDIRFGHTQVMLRPWSGILHVLSSEWKTAVWRSLQLGDHVDMFDIVRGWSLELQPQPALQEELPCQLGDQGGGHVDRPVETICVI